MTGPREGPSPAAARPAIILVDHGSTLDAANDLVRAVADMVRGLDSAYHVEHAHMELAEPTLARALESCVRAGCLDVTVHPYMLGPGRHASLDIPRLAAEAARAHPGVTVRVAAPLGLHELIARVVLERVREARAMPPEPPPPPESAGGPGLAPGPEQRA